MSSPETDDAGTWFVRSTLPLVIAASEYLQTDITPHPTLRCYYKNLNANTYWGTRVVLCPFKSLFLIQNDLHLSLSAVLMQCVRPSLPWCSVSYVSSFLLVCGMGPFNPDLSISSAGLLSVVAAVCL